MSELLRFYDATESPDDRVDFPEVVEELLQMRFRRVGRVVAEPVDGGYERIAADFNEANAETFLAHCDVPTSILRPPDGSAFVEVSWFWDSPSVRIRTILADGALVETNRQWNQPALPVELEQYWTDTDVRKDMAKRRVPRRGRSVEIIQTDSCAEQWAHHQEHVSRYAAARGSAPIRHERIDQVLEMMRTAFTHDEAVERRTVGLWKPLVLAYGAVGILLIIVLTLLGQFVAAIATALVFALFSTTVPRLVISKVRILPVFMRPPYL